MDGGMRRFRFLILLGALAMIASGFLPWWRAGGDSVSGVLVPAEEGIGLEGPGVIIFGAAILTLVLLDIGYMRGRWGFVLDAPLHVPPARRGRRRCGPVPRLGAVVGRLPAPAAAVAGLGAGRGRRRARALRGGVGIRHSPPLLTDAQPSAQPHSSLAASSSLGGCAATGEIVVGDPVVITWPGDAGDRWAR